MLELQTSKSFLPAKQLGSMLQEAGLLSEPQLEVALWDQTLYWELQLGEILDLRGWVHQKTCDFFVTHFLTLSVKAQKQRLGFYLREASLLSKEQILKIVEQQMHTETKFGALAVQNGWLQQQTLDFLLKHLSLRSAASSAERKKAVDTAAIDIAPVAPQAATKPTLLQIERDLDAWIS